MSKPPPPAPTASAVGPCPTVSKFMPRNLLRNKFVLARECCYPLHLVVFKLTHSVSERTQKYFRPIDRRGLVRSFDRLLTAYSMIKTQKHAICIFIYNIQRNDLFAGNANKFMIAMYI